MLTCKNTMFSFVTTCCLQKKKKKTSVFKIEKKNKVISDEPSKLHLV